MTKDLILAIDNGTQSMRAVIFDLQGNPIAKVRIPLQTHHAPQPGWAEHEPSYYWSALCQACQELFQQYPQYRERLAGVTLTTQRSTIINVDEKGQPLRPAIVWLDQRRTYGLKPLGGLWGLAFALSGMTKTVAYLQAEAEVNWVYKHQPEIWERSYKILYLSGYLTYLLTGRFIDSVGSQVGYMPLDYKKLHWASSWDWKWQVLPIKPHHLTELVPPASILGEITPQASQASGIPEGLPLVAAAADKACEVIGSGCIDPYMGCLSYGTTATICTTHHRYVEPIPLIPPYPSAIPGAYCMEVQIYRGFWMVSWFKEEFGYPEQMAAEQSGIEAEALFDKMIGDVPAGSMGLVLQPYWSPGLKIPGPEAKGAIIGFGDVHTRAHLYRAILEGLAYALREGKERTEKRSHQPITELRVSGGGSQSEAAMQITADVFGLPAARPHIYDTSALGAAIDAAVGLKLHTDFPAAIQAMTRIQRVYEPRPREHEIYDGLYRHVYLKMYRHLKLLYEEIQQVTNYPPNLR
ncbi:MAG: FGGY-family carbohydrate kinase [Anaerolineales bacterium]|nr:FGGY-family carbohydrate kinase [Anaerolineales bacterium]